MPNSLSFNHFLRASRYGTETYYHISSAFKIDTSTPFRVFFAANHINILRKLRKTAKKILKILRSPCLSDCYKTENENPPDGSEGDYSADYS